MKLLDCPFCGDPAVWDKVNHAFRPDQYVCGCTNTLCRGWVKTCYLYDDFEIMIREWNRRYVKAKS